MTLQHTVIAPGQVWRGLSIDHPWKVRVKRLSLSSVEFETLAKGQRGRSRVRGRCTRQWMPRAKFLAQHRLERDVSA
jgi:hypothetical protein